MRRQAHLENRFQDPIDLAGRGVALHHDEHGRLLLKSGSWQDRPAGQVDSTSTRPPALARPTIITRQPGSFEESRSATGDETRRPGIANACELTQHREALSILEHVAVRFFLGILIPVSGNIP
jgi:hypothetical protein